MRACLGWLMVVVVVALPRLTQAQEAADPAAERSEALFLEGYALWKAGDKLEACNKFRDSHAAKPSVGNLLNMGRCAQLQQRFATAHGFYAEAKRLAELAGDQKRAAAAEKFLVDAAAKASMLTIAIPAGVAGVQVLLNGSPLPADQLGQAMALEPGAYSVSASAPGHQHFQQVVSLAGDADRQTLQVTLLAIAPPVPVTPPPVPQPQPRPPPVIDVAPAEGGLTGIQIGALVVGGVGVVGVAIGAIMGGAALGATSDLESQCVADEASGTWGCDDEGLAQKDSIATQATVSTVGFVAGGALVATGVVMFLLGGQDGGSEAARLLPHIGPADVGLGLEGRF